ncbi:hypothetical protein DFJ74DRAFT_667700 [Hyaloraphidium curvatum]|nr:hypothetical protein DFJ74DRAFT_667700 [Hyaloraphidium curvatum]
MAVPCRRPLLFAAGLAVALFLLPRGGCRVAVTVLPDGLRALDLSGCGLSSLPAAALDLLRRDRDVAVLYASGNRLSALPDLSATGVTRLGLRGNKLAGPLDCSRLPPALEHLILTDNALTSIPEDCEAKFRRLKKLMLARNGLRRWPDIRTPKLELVRLAQNDLREVPRALLDRRKAPELRWLSLGSNPCRPLPPNPLASLPPKSLSDVCPNGTQEPLGKGTSGTALRCGTRVVKRFAGLSSDGDRAYEAAATALVPHNPSLLPPTASVDRGAALAFPLVAGKPAAKPPSARTVSRDVYPPSAQRIPPGEVAAMLRSLSDGIRALHLAGVVHGDVYAHNVLLVPPSGNDGWRAVLIDLGAATLTSGLDPEERKALENLDCRAFGTMVWEWAGHLAEEGGGKELRKEVEGMDPCGKGKHGEGKRRGKHGERRGKHGDD